jgi:hypothetical protein
MNDERRLFHRRIPSVNTIQEGMTYVFRDWLLLPHNYNTRDIIPEHPLLLTALGGSSS